MSTSVKWKNGDRFKKKLALLPPAVRAAATLGLEERAEFVVSAMKRLVPVNRGVLRDSIKWEGPRADAARDSTVTITAGDKRAFYVRFVEYGTHKMRAEPFFWPTWRAFKRSGVAIVTRHVNSAIKAMANNG